MPVTTSADASPALLNSLRHGLSGASDAQLHQVVTMVDALAQRGAVDALLAPLRPRLAQLQPARPLRFARLLFLPLDPLIVQPQQWTAGAITIPRSAIIPLADQVRAALNEDAQAIDAIIVGRTVAEEDVIQTASALLWRRAGDILAAAACPPSWTEAGLPVSTYTPIVQTAAIALRLASRIDALARGDIAHGETPATLLDRVLNEAEAAGPAAWRVTGILLLLRHPRKQDVLRALSASTRQQDPAMRVATEQAIEAVLGILENQDRDTGKSLGVTTAGLDAVVTLLNAIVADGAGPARGQRVQSLRLLLDATCQAKLRQGLSEHLLAPLDAILAAPPDEAAITHQLADLESAARSLRALELAGQRLGKPDAYASMLRDAADQIDALSPNAALTQVDRALLVELLVGSDAALATLAGERRHEAA